jgi:hypothetical protein
MTVRLKRKSENWRRRLPRPVRLRSGKTLATLADCRAYCLDLDDYEAARPAWQRTAAMLIEAAEGGDLDRVNRQFEAILLHQNKIALPPD